MTVYEFDSEGYYTGARIAQRSPLEAGVFLIPKNATTEKPALPAENKEMKWNGSIWEEVDSRAYLALRAEELRVKLEETNEWFVKLYESDGNDWYQLRPQVDIDSDTELEKEKIYKDKCLKALKDYSWVDYAELSSDDNKAIKDYMKACKDYIKSGDWSQPFPADPEIMPWN